MDGLQKTLQENKEYSHKRAHIKEKAVGIQEVEPAAFEQDVHVWTFRSSDEWSPYERDVIVSDESAIVEQSIIDVGFGHSVVTAGEQCAERLVAHLGLLDFDDRDDCGHDSPVWIDARCSDLRVRCYCRSRGNQNHRRECDHEGGSYQNELMHGLSPLKSAN